MILIVIHYEVSRQNSDKGKHVKVQFIYLNYFFEVVLSISIPLILRILTFLCHSCDLICAILQRNKVLPFRSCPLEKTFQVIEEVNAELGDMGISNKPPNRG